LDLEQLDRRTRSVPGATTRAVPEIVPQIGFHNDRKELNYGALGAWNTVPASLPGPRLRPVRAAKQSLER
jgi:hypothetical protein